MQLESPTGPRQKFLALIKGLRAGGETPKQDANASCDVPFKINDVEFSARHTDPGSEQFVLQMSLGKIPKTDASTTMEKLMVMNLDMLRQFGPTIALAKDGEILFQSRDSLASMTGPGFKAAVESLCRIRKDFGRAMAKK